MPFRKPVESPPLPDLRESFRAVTEYVYSLGVNRNNVRIQAYQEFLEAISRARMTLMTLFKLCVSGERSMS